MDGMDSKLIVGGCSFFNEVFEVEITARNNLPKYIKTFISNNQKLSHKEIGELYYKYVNDGKIEHHKNFKLSNQLSNKLNKQVISFTKNGNSNDSILDDIINYVIENKTEKNNTIIIGLTSPTRIKRYYNPIEKFVDLKPIWFHKESYKLHPEYIIDEHYSDIRKYYEIYLKYFYDLESYIKLLNQKLSILKFISEINNHKIIIIDNLLFPFEEDVKSVPYKIFEESNKDVLFYFDDNNFSWPRFIKSYDIEYKLSHPNSSDIKTLVDKLYE